jgi:hypothetical protein
VRGWLSSIWVISEKIRTPPDGGNFFCGGKRNLFLIIVSVLGRPKGIGELASNFFFGGGMDGFLG